MEKVTIANAYEAFIKGDYNGMADYLGDLSSKELLEEHMNAYRQGLMQGISILAEYVCHLCCESDSCDSCTISSAFNTDDERVEYQQVHGCVCGSFYTDKRSPCITCPSIRNGDCDGPDEHCAEYDCPHKNEQRCPVDIANCPVLKANR